MNRSEMTISENCFLPLTTNIGKRCSSHKVNDRKHASNSTPEEVAVAFNNESVDIGILFIANKLQLHRAAMKILGCQERAEDVVQDAYLKAIEAASALNIKQPLAYLFQIVRNLAIDKHRRTSFETRVFVDEEEGLNTSGTDSPETIAIDRQQLHIAAQALAKLPSRTRKVFELYRLSGFTQREIAKQLGVSTTLVNFMIQDALACCRDAMKSLRAV